MFSCRRQPRGDLTTDTTVTLRLNQQRLALRDLLSSWWEEGFLKARAGAPSIGGK
jgi:hypothetical protein